MLMRHWQQRRIETGCRPSGMATAVQLAAASLLIRRLQDRWQARLSRQQLQQQLQRWMLRQQQPMLSQTW
jgi:hypothetical protein